MYAVMSVLSGLTEVYEVLARHAVSIVYTIHVEGYINIHVHVENARIWRKLQLLHLLHVEMPEFGVHHGQACIRTAVDENLDNLRVIPVRQHAPHQILHPSLAPSPSRLD